MSDPVLIAIIATTGAVLGLAPSTLLAYATLKSSKKNATKADVNAVKVDDLVVKAGEIHSLTNSHLSEITGDLRVARQEIKGLRELVSSLVKKPDASP